MKTSSKISFLMLAAVACMTPSQVKAFGGPPGGPFSNGSYFPNDGTFSAVVRGTGANGTVLVGTLQFSTTSGSGPRNAQTTSLEGANNSGVLSVSEGTGGVGSTGVSNIYYNGSSFRGNSQGSYNPQSSGLTVTFQASTGGQGNGTINVNARYTTTNTSNGTTTTTQETLPVKTINYVDSKSLDGFADCSTSNAFPNQKFQGSGTATLQQLDFAGGNADPTVQSIPVPVSVTGVRLSNVTSSFSTTPVTNPSVITTTILTNP